MPLMLETGSVLFQEQFEEEKFMSYVDEMYERVVTQNPGEPEFHQAAKEVLDSLKLVIDANEEKYRSV